MPRFLALTSKGLGGVLEQELKDLDYKVLKASQTRALFECNWEKLYFAHIMLRTATRILLPILDFTAYKNEELYKQIQKHDFTKYISPKQSIWVVCNSSDKNGPFKNDVFVAQLVKDAIVDQFRDKYDQRPNVGKQADLQIWIRMKGPSFSVSIDLTGPSLTQRGYRTEAGIAPLREHIAAGLLKLTKWDRQKDLLDPMCGSGTFLIEGALIALNKGPGLYRKDFAFHKHVNFQKEAWVRAKQLAERLIKPELPIQILGYDIDPRMVEMARNNVKRAGLEKFVKIEQRAIKDLKNTLNHPLVVCNPPYGERLKEKVLLEETYKDLGNKLKTEFKETEAWLLSGNKELTPALRMKAERAYAVDNNGLDCKWLKYPLYK